MKSISRNGSSTLFRADAVPFALPWASPTVIQIKLFQSLPPKATKWLNINNRVVQPTVEESAMIPSPKGENINNRVVRPMVEKSVMIPSPEGENLNNRGCQPTDKKQVETHPRRG